MRSKTRVWCLIAFVLLLPGLTLVIAQDAPTAPATPPPDALGRSTPRGTVLGFLSAARKGDYELARQYLNTRLTEAVATRRAEQLFVVLDAKLPARLTEVIDVPEGSRSNVSSPDDERIATLAEGHASVDVVLERVQPAKSGAIWLFSSRTVDAVPAVYNRVLETRAAARLPGFLLDTRISGIEIFEWLGMLVAIPLLYLATGLLNRILTPVVRFIGARMGQPRFRERNALAIPARLLLLAIASQWLLSSLGLSLLSRQFFSSLMTLLAIAAIAWLLMYLGQEMEASVLRRLPTSNPASISLLRVGRRIGDAFIVVAALLATLRHFGIDPTPALAGLGVGGIAVALAAQKTLENVIAGASLIFDQAVRVGDSLKVGEIVGTVDEIGLRSTRIRTLDRTVVIVPNSQIASAAVETLSARDKFWFHPVVGLRYETTQPQLQDVMQGIRRMLDQHSSIARESARVRLIRLGAFSLDIEIFAYVIATDWTQFLEIQEQLLLTLTDIVSRAGTAMAFPSQTMYVAGSPRDLGPAGSLR